MARVVPTTKTGFTIIENLVAMSFLISLILFIGYVSLQLLNTYRKGISIRDVNKTADLIIGDVQSTIANSGNISCAVKHYQNEYMTPLDDCGNLFNANYDPMDTSRITGAAICTGKHSYIWNYGAALTEDGIDHSKLFRYATNDGGYQDAGMIKVKDASKFFCTRGDLTVADAHADPDRPVIYGQDNGLSDNKKVTELIGRGDRLLALHSFAVVSSQPDPATYQALYEFEFVLGTFQNHVINTVDAKCQTLAEASSPHPGTDPNKKVDKTDLSYCAINKFNFATRAIKGKGKW